MLKGIKVLEFQGLAPSVFCGMYFADQGADVILIARPQSSPFSMEINKNIMNRNKRCIKLSLKNQEEKQIIIQLIKSVDIIIDPYRPGVLEKQRLGPQQLNSLNPKVILLRVSGYGQTGNMALKPGHDLNYISSSGILHLINKQKDNLEFPSNYLADFVSASLGIFGTLKALLNRKSSSSGFVIDCSLAGGCQYLKHLTLENQKFNRQDINYNLKYFETQKSRYVSTIYQMGKIITSEQIFKAIQSMQKKNETFLKNEKFEIAQIKKIYSIRNSSLGNPFGSPQIKKLSNKMPDRDQNRVDILRDYKILNAKL